MLTFQIPPLLAFHHPSSSRLCRRTPSLNLTSPHNNSPTLPSNTPLAPPQTPSNSTEPPSEIVLCHATADFDSLAAAVGLAKLRSPTCKVVLPAGSHNAVRRYLSLHKQFFPLIDPKLVDHTKLRWIGVADTTNPNRLGVAREWLKHAQVYVVDHHVAAAQDARIGVDDVGNGLQCFVDHVGAVSTLVVELFQQRGIIPSRAELTLLALGIHTDTGSLSYENTTPRDAAALAWLLHHGACQRSIARFARNYLNAEQQRLLAHALDSMHVQTKDGFKVACVILETPAFVKGMSAVAQATLELADLDVVLLTAVSPGKGIMKHVSLIGRAGSRSEGVDFNELFSEHGGGGHAKAASASLKMNDVVQVKNMLDLLVERLFENLPPPVLAGDFMSHDVKCVAERESMDKARTLLFESGHTGLAVVSGDGGLVGVVSRQDVALAERKGLLATPVKGWVARKVITVTQDTLLHEIEAKLVDNNIGRLPVVENGRLVGIITRSDVLMQRRLYSPGF